MSTPKDGHDVHIIFAGHGVGTVTIDGVQMVVKNLRVTAGARKQTEVTLTILAKTLNMPAPRLDFPAPEGDEYPKAAPIEAQAPAQAAPVAKPTKPMTPQPMPTAWRDPEETKS